MSNIITYQMFENVDIRLGTIVDVEEYKQLNKPSFKLKIDFGNKIGIKKSSAQLLKHYDSKKLIGKQIAAVINFKPKQIGKFISEVLVLGFPDDQKSPVLISPDLKLRNGVKLY